MDTTSQIRLIPIPELPGYRAGEDGTIWNEKRKLKGYLDKSNGYRRVTLITPQGKRFFYVHTLILVAFIGPRPDRAECRHLDGCRGNNRLTNLAWGTSLENHDDRKRHGTAAKKLTTDQVRRMRWMHSEGAARKQLVAEFGVSGQMIWQITTGKKWKHILPNPVG